MTRLTNTFKTKNENPITNPPKTGLSTFRIDTRLQVGLGIFMQAIAYFLCIAFISHLFYGTHDQAVVESIGEIGIKEAGKSIHNWLGLLGALTAYYVMFRWLGITAFLLLPFLYLSGSKLIKSRFLKHISLYRTSILAVFTTLWLNIAMGYLHVLKPRLLNFEKLLGGAAFELGLIFGGFLGWGTFIFLLATLFIFVVAYFNFTSIQPIIIWYNQLKGLWMRHLPAQSHQKDTYSEQHVSATGEKISQANDNLNPIDLLLSLKEKPMSASLPLSLTISPSDTTESDSIQEEGMDTPSLSSLTHFSDEISDHEFEKLADYDPALDLPNYHYPTSDLLIERERTTKEVTQEELEQNKDKIVKTLTDFKIGIASIKATIGPTVTLYEIVPEAGIKISKIKNLEDDIALNLAALGIRIIAPIPGKGTIGIEVPNKNRAMVPFRDLLINEKFTKSTMELPIILGKSIANEAVIVDLVRMPHVLIAGATGQGKSVGLNVLLASLIYKKHPSQLKLVLVDPKKVELSLYSHLERHFLAKLPSNEDPIITETKKVVNTLQSLCIEMDTRYELLKQAGTRNIKEYNDKFIKRRLNPERGHHFLPYIVVVIDEFADMMMTAGKEVELPIARLAQLARAIGIHLVLATQRPSVNVITGIIKANFPVRISFRVTSKVDSRTILDTGGAEQLVGQGDMLLAMNSSIIRLQCPFLDTQEIEHICDYIGSQPSYSSAYLLPDYDDNDNNDTLNVDLGDQDPFFEEAARLIIAHQQGSTSLIQRKLKLGYNRAGRLMDQLQAAGIVGPSEGSKAREVLLTDEQELQRLLKNR